jgi:hypothetical protein
MRPCVEIRLLLCIPFAALSLGLGACAVVAHPSGGPSPTPQRSVTPHTSATAQPTSGPGQVTVAVDKTHYAPTDTITVTILNGLAAIISTTDHQTNCTIVTLERLVNGAWQPEGACRLMTPTRVVPISPGTTVQQLSSSAWPTGTYRVAFRYFTEPDAELGQGATPGQGAVVYSATFTIG